MRHAILSASSAHRWLVCTPSARLEQMETEECSVYAQEGTAAHELAEIKLSYRFGKTRLSVYQDRLEEFKKTCEYYSKEFEEYVDDFVEFVVEQTEGLTDYHIYFELRVNFSNIVPQGFGTADVVIVTEDTIQVIDLKFGVGVPVSAKENPQLRLYGLGTLNLFPNSKIIKMTIAQPRLYSIDTEELSKEELVDWGINVVRPRADEAIKGEGPIQASEDACRFCKLRGKCKVRADAQLAVAQQEFSAVVETTTPEQALSDEQISKILEIAPFFIDWFKDVQKHAYERAMQGGSIPGYKLVEGRSNRVITNAHMVRETLNKYGWEDAEIMKAPELLGISKLEALVGKRAFAEICADYLFKPQGKISLVREDDKRPAISTIENDFKE